MAKRMSGSRMAESESYAVPVDGVWQLDVGAIKVRADVYLAEAAEAGRYSLAGLCIALDITRETLDWWRRGYVGRADAEANLAPNKALADCMAKAMLHLQRYWEESGKPATLGLKLLEATGAFGARNAPGQTGGGPPFDLGRYKKFAR
jgi:hypothetical protein